ncbi:MAG TPA: hypothetical protein PLN63_02450 [Paludibacteraceae bacterium]|nr:hypothetical protein [Paludibacteraceae bacterium]HOU67948.1 hypothetical protein [Paludibacteraceae bacterium]HPH62473.1 hypothetical protein [Paludibacteraceae bacterium]HQF49867.1 hypothetical protein [Paludibacteraceae bacterium]
MKAKSILSVIFLFFSIISFATVPPTEMIFEGVSMSDTWNMLLKLEDKGYLNKKSEKVFGSFLSTFEGKYGPKNDKALVMITYTPNENKKATSAVVELKKPCVEIETLVSYLSKQYGKFTKKAIVNDYGKATINYVMKTKKYSIIINEDNEKILVLYFNYPPQDK